MISECCYFYLFIFCNDLMSYVFGIKSNLNIGDIL